MFEHSVRVPRHYKIAANIFKQVSTEGGSVKTLLYDNKLRHFRTNVLYALITESIRHSTDLDKVFEDTNLIENEPRLDPWLAKILTTELLFGKKSLPGNSKPEKTILSYKEKFEKYTSEHKDDMKTKGTQRPRYVRINTNLLTTSDAIRAFQDEGYRFIRCTSGSYDDYLNQIQNLSENEFTQDYHVKTVYVFAAGTKMHESELYMENKIILQDKATAMAVHLLAPPTGSTVLDMCAAPGMKTTQMAAYMRNEGKIYAVERNEKRYQTLCDFVTKSGCKCVETINKDALEIKKRDYDDVEYILLDPSCSGSGMELCVHSYIEEARLSKLTSLQEKFLKHAMNSFPNAKRIVYSTCSLYPEENERVVTNAVKTSRAKWRVQDVKEMLKGQWNNIGSGMYGSMGTRCMYARPETDFTTGFFLAVLDRDQKDLDKSNAAIGKEESVEIKKDEKKVPKSKTKKNKTEKATEIQDIVQTDDVTEVTMVSEYQEKPSKKKKKIKNILNGNELELNVRNNDESKTERKKKRKLEDNDQTEKATEIQQGSFISEDILQGNDVEITEHYEKPPKKKKKKFLKDDELDQNIHNDENSKTERKKKRKIEESDEATEVTKENRKVKNKKKSVKSDDSEQLTLDNNISLELNEDTLEAVAKKKKKKHKKCEE